MEGFKFKGIELWRAEHLEGLTFEDLEFGGFGLWRVFNLEGLQFGGFET